MTRGRRVAGTVATAAGTAATLHALPAVTAVGPLRRAVLPRLAGVGAADHVALTFDDGPDPASTPRFLAMLDRRGVRATFFLLAGMAAKAPGLVGEIAAAGHEVAVHGWEHRLLLKRAPGAVRDDVGRAYDDIAELAGTAPRWYRPPYGVFTWSALLAARQRRMTPVLWTSWGCDWTATATPTSVLIHVGRQLRGGATVLLHDSDCTSTPGSWHATLGALPRLLDAVAARGLRVGPLSDHDLR